MDCKEIDIRTLLPQKEPFVMVDKLLHCSTDVTRTSLHIREDNFFVEDGVFSEYGIIENFAQTCAARMGYMNCFVKKEQVRIGFIGAVKGFELHQLPACNNTLTTEIRVKSEVFNITLVDARSWIGDQIVASCEMKISESV